MNKTIRKVLLAGGMCMLSAIAFCADSHAEELKDENLQRLEQVTGIDEEGNIYVIEDVNGKVDVEDDGIATYAVEAKVVNFNTNGNVVTYYTEYLTGNSGYTNGAYGADAAYLGTYNGKVRFMLSGVVGEVYAEEVQVLNVSAVEVVSCYKVMDGRLYHYIAQNMTTPGYATKLDNGPSPSYLSTDVTYYSYDGHYFYTDYSVMLADYQNNVRSNSVNPSNPFYNYFQYLPLRSSSSYTSTELNSMISSKASSYSNSKMLNMGSSFVNHQNTYGINALIMTGVAANESAWGSSSISQSKNNLFGLNAVDSSPGTSASTYASVDECIRQFADGWMSRGYLYGGDWRYSGGYLGNKAGGINVRYASDPYWGEKAANHIWALDKLGSNKDYKKYTIGIKDTVSTSHNNVAIKNNSSASSTTLYNSTTASGYAVLVLQRQAENGYYKIQSDSVLNASRSAVTNSSGAYNQDTMYAYMETEYVKVVHEGESDTATYTNYKTTKEIEYRSGPGTNYDVVGTIAAGTRVKVQDGYSVTANGYTWYRILYNSQHYYIVAKYLQAEAWYAEAVEYVMSKGYMLGLNSTTFGEASTLSRAQFVVILHRMEGTPTVTSAKKFPDVANGIWYADAVAWANSTGVVTGYVHNGCFGPANAITREQMAVMMYRYAQYKGYPTSDKVSLNSYLDGQKVSDFAQEAMKWAVANGIITGKTTGVYLEPQGIASRAECATIIMRFVEKFQ